MPKPGEPLEPERVADIVRLAGEGVSAYRIAKLVGVSSSTVHKYAPAGSFDRSAMAVAVEAHKVDAAARRAVQAQRYLDIVDDVQRRALEAYEQTALAGIEGEVRRWKTERPPARETAELVKAAQAATMAELRISDHDKTGPVDEAGAVLDSFMDAVARRAAELGDDG